MKWPILASLLVGVVGTTGWSQDGELPGDEPPAAVEPLSSGPIHEAYAEPVALDDSEPFVVPVEPPKDIEEIPPEVKPDDARVIWIPGYWSWDDERQDYIWVSGTWRKPPVGRTWQSGEWQAVAGGYQWIPGRWVADGQANAQLLPAPPPSIDNGPSSPAESENVFWVPGCWQYRAQRYVWRPGFWSPCQENWVWVPDHYVPAAGGCYLVSGYWDYGWDVRGTLYAPCYINRRVAYAPGWYYSPSVVVDVSGAFFHLWVRPSYRHYYFGDYYSPYYASYGFLPWYDFYGGYRHGYDPLFTYYNWRFRRDRVDLYHHLKDRHHHYQAHAQAGRRSPDGHGPGGGRRAGGLSNAEREALVHRTADRKAMAVNLNQREAIRERLLEQHKERLRTGGDSLGGSPRNNLRSGRIADSQRAVFQQQRAPENGDTNTVDRVENRGRSKARRIASDAQTPTRRESKLAELGGDRPHVVRRESPDGVNVDATDALNEGLGRRQRPSSRSAGPPTRDGRVSSSAIEERRSLKQARGETTGPMVERQGAATIQPPTRRVPSRAATGESNRFSPRNAPPSMSAESRSGAFEPARRRTASPSRERIGAQAAPSGRVRSDAFPSRSMSRSAPRNLQSSPSRIAPSRAPSVQPRAPRSLPRASSGPAIRSNSRGPSVGSSQSMRSAPPRGSGASRRGKN